MLKWAKQQQYVQQRSLAAVSKTFASKEELIYPKYPSNIQNIKTQARKRYSTGNFKTNSQINTLKSKANMPTATNLERRLHRRSLDNYLDARTQRTSRFSLTGNENKENFGVHFARSPLRSTSQVALQDLSNGRSPRQRRQTLDGAQHNAASTTPSSRRTSVGRFSDNFSENETPLSLLRFRNGLREESLSSSRMGDVTLDRMLDAIIQSAKKDIKINPKPLTPNVESGFHPMPETTLYSDEEREESIHEMEVRTPNHLKRQRVVRRKNPNKANKNSAPPPPPPAAANPPLIGLTLPNGIPSPGTPIFKRDDNEMALLAAMETPQDLMFIVDHNMAMGGGGGGEEYDSIDNANDLQRCSTPALKEVQSIKRCLSFSSSTTDEDDADYSAAKRSSVASSNGSSAGGDHFSSGRFSRNSENSMKVTPSLKGAIELAIHSDQRTLNVHVIRCRDLQRSNGSTALNAYVKVALIRKANAKQADVYNHFQRTAVHRHSSRPYFDHRFAFDLGNYRSDQCESSSWSLENVDSDFEERLQLAVWHRDRQLKRSEFLGCMSFPLRTLLQQPISGSFKLQSQACLNKPQVAIALQVQHQQSSINHHTSTTATTVQHNLQHHYPLQQTQQPHFQQQQHHISNTQYSTNCKRGPPFDTAPQKLLPTSPSSQPPPLKKVMASLAHQKSNDDGDGVSIDSTMAQTMTGQSTGAGAGENAEPMVLSKKALHQRDADENLFLRFLELDPLLEDTTGIPGPQSSTGAASSTKSASQLAPVVPPARRLSSSGRTIGRTPFTITKKLTRTAERGFGFSIVWTHPPRVEKIEPGLSADRCGILPGDYVIFVDQHNVVTMPEADVLNLIRSQGATLTLEIFRRSGSGSGSASVGVSAGGSSVGVPPALSIASRSHIMNGKTTSSQVASTASNYASDEQQSTATTAAIGAALPTMMQRASCVVGSNAAIATQNAQHRPSTACSGASSIEAAKRRLNLPQVTFSKESIVPVTDNRRRFLLQLISREQNFISAINFGMQRFVQPLLDRKDLITPNDHRTLFQNMDELLRISEDILEQLCQDEQEPQMNFASRVYLSKTTAICAAYKKYCNGIKRADCVLVNKSRQTGSEFIAFITEPQVPRKRPDLTMFIHRPLQHFREILKLMQMLASNCHVDTEEHKNFSTVINELQAAYREITVSSGLMEPLGEGRPLLTLQDLESRMVFTKCKPFTLAVQGRQWIFGGDLSRVEGRSVKPYWTLLFSDIIVFAKVSRDRVLFITEEPIPIGNIVDSCFHMRKKTTEFRLTVDPNGRLAESPTSYCAPDLTRTPKKGSRRKGLVLRAPSLELKAVWQNLLQRQIFLVNAALGSTPLSSPLDSPDVLNTLVPLSDIGVASASIGSIKMPSMDSINLRNQQKQQNHRKSNASEQIEMLIDEKCRILNKTGTPKSSALHLANWMKGQLDKQQEQARLAAACARDHISPEDEHLLYPDSDQDERITYWTRQQLEKRTKELNLAKEQGHLSAKPNFSGKRLSGVEELSVSDVSVSQMSTSDSQITVRSSPVVLDKLAVCRHCHKNCQQQQQHSAIHSNNNEETEKQHNHHSPSPTSTNVGAPVCTSLKVQHSQSSPNRCGKINGIATANGGSRPESVSSISSSTITGEQPSEISSKVVASSSRRETFGDTESDVAQLLTDDLSQSEAATDDSIGAIQSSSSGIEDVHRKITDTIGKLRILDQKNEARTLDGGLMNGHCSASSGGDSEQRTSPKSKTKPQPPPRKFLNAKEVVTVSSQQQIKATITLNETGKVIKSTDDDDKTSKTKSLTPTKSPRSPCTPTNSKVNSSSFIPCHCNCTTADFDHSTISPDECEQKTCKLIESPKQSPKLLRQNNNSTRGKNALNSSADYSHRNCRCVCGNEDKRRQQSKRIDNDDEDLSLLLIGLAQFSPAAQLLNMKTTPTAPMPTPTSTQSKSQVGDASFLPTIAVVPPTPDAVLTQTSTHVWDNSGTNIITSTATKVHINNEPRQAVVENIPEDSCDDSPLDEEPPYRPMSNALRRYGTMSSLEKMPSDDRIDGDELDDLDDDDDDDDDDGDDGGGIDDSDGNDDGGHDNLAADYGCEIDDRTRADKVNVDDIHVVTKVFYNSGESSTSGSSNIAAGAWTSRAGTFVSGKMSFFEESRAFIDKYLGRWNQDHSSTSATQGHNASENDEQGDECTSGGTSGEEIWGTPTSGGDNDDGNLANSENTHSSPTKSSTSLNDDDDTELMMDELLMAPPMTASTIRGLLPRRRLEPLFEEETESDEEKTQQESEELKKGETTTNGRNLEDSAGSSSDGRNHSEISTEDEQEEGEEDEEEDEPTSTIEEDRLYPNLQTTIIGPRPLRDPAAALPVSLLKASSCEYLLEQRSVELSQTDSNFSSSSNVPITTSSDKMASITMTELSKITDETVTTTMMRKSNPQTTPEITTSITTMMKTPKSLVRSLTFTITSRENANISKDSSDCSKLKARTNVVRPAKFNPPPPPPPRRLLLTQTNLATVSDDKDKAAPKATSLQHKFGGFADSYSSADADVDDDDEDYLDCGIHCSTSSSTNSGTHQKSTTSAKESPLTAPMSTTSTQKQTITMKTSVNTRDFTEETTNKTKKVASNIKSSSENTAPVATVSKRPSSTIIETSLLGSVEPQKPTSTSSTTVLMRKHQTLPEKDQKKESSPAAAVQAPAGSSLSPRLEMRLALNHDILGDEDLISYNPGPDLTTILGHDLSTFHRLTGRDLLNRSTMNRVQPKEAVISFSQQRNSKMDTPTVNRRRQQQQQQQQQQQVSLSTTNRDPVVIPMGIGLSIGRGIGSSRVASAGVSQQLPNRNTWSSSAFADQSDDVSVSGADSSKNFSYSSDESKLSDLEILARREKIYCMSQLKSGSQAKMMTMTKTTTTTTMTKKETKNRDSLINHPMSPLMRRTSTTSMGAAAMTEQQSTRNTVRVRKIGRDETALMATGKGNRLKNFLKRRGSETPVSPNCSQCSLNDSTPSETPTHRQQQLDTSPSRKDNDKPSLNRRLWKQITKRRRANSISEVTAS